MTDVDFGIYHIETHGEHQDIVSLLPHEYVFEHGIPPEAIVGILIKSQQDGGIIEPNNFARNSAFIEFLHDFISKNGLRLYTSVQYFPLSACNFYQVENK